MLDRPELPLHTNGSERDLRPQVIKRKISGGTRADLGRACRDAFLGLLLTCAKLGVSFWDYLGHRLGVPGADAPYLPDLVRLRSPPTPERPGFCPSYRCVQPTAVTSLFVEVPMPSPSPEPDEPVAISDRALEARVGDLAPPAESGR